MSELKEYYYYEDRVVTPATHLYRVYHADAADKVIAEKDKEIARLNDKALQYKVLDKEHCRDLNTQERHFALQIAHNKYKRCLAMARWCRELLRLMRTYEVSEDFWNLEPGQDAEYFCKKGDFYSKWRKRWLKIAEKFKEAK